MSTFVLHFMVYSVIMLMLVALNALTWDGFPWSAFPAVGWGAFLAIHGSIAWLSANAGVPAKLVDRAQQPVSLTVPRKQTPEQVNQSELDTLIGRGLSMVDTMRSIGRTMRTASSRREAMNAVSAIENSLIALEDNLEELPLAREFMSSLLEPAHHLFVEYNNLADKDIQGAKALLQQVEIHDLPQITAKATAIYEKVHRGTMIDLEVAREMLQLSDRDSTDIS